MNRIIEKLAKRILNGYLLERVEAENLLAMSRSDLDDLLYWANEIRKQYFGNKVQVCSIVPGKLGGCSEDCAFCAQSARYHTQIGPAREIGEEEILNAARQAYQAGVRHFGIVNSGKRVTDKEVERLGHIAEKIKQQYNMTLCGSFGILNDTQAQSLVDSGFKRYNHNLETSPVHFSEIVSTHEYEERAETIQKANQAGLKVCAGGIFGIGEQESDRLDMAFELRRLGADMIPLNFLHPIDGTPLADVGVLAPREILRIIAIYRFILPDKSIKVAGGRVLNLRDMQSWIFYAGCTSIITGNYLTTAGRETAEDMRMLADLGLEAV